MREILPRKQPDINQRLPKSTYPLPFFPLPLWNPIIVSPNIIIITTTAIITIIIIIKTTATRIARKRATLTRVSFLPTIISVYNPITISIIIITITITILRSITVIARIRATVITSLAIDIAKTKPNLSFNNWNQLLSLPTRKPSSYLPTPIMEKERKEKEEKEKMQYIPNAEEKERSLTY